MDRRPGDVAAAMRILQGAKEMGWTARRFLDDICRMPGNGSLKTRTDTNSAFSFVLTPDRE